MRTSGTACGSICASATAVMPMTAGERPLSAALIQRTRRSRSKNGTTASTSTKDGRKIATALTTAPATPATR